MERIGRISFNRSDFIGRGQFGCVFRGKLSGLFDIAVKRVEKKILKEENIPVGSLFRADAHPNIIRTYCTKEKNEDFM